MEEPKVPDRALQVDKRKIDLVAVTPVTTLYTSQQLLQALFLY